MEALFSLTTDKVLALFLNHPRAQFYPNQIVHLTKKYPNSVNQSLKRLVKLKLLTKHKVGNYVFYSLNRDNPYLEEIKAIFLKMKLISQPKWRLILDRILHPNKRVVMAKDESSCLVEIGNYRLNLSFVSSQDTRTLKGNFVIDQLERNDKIGV